MHLLGRHRIMVGLCLAVFGLRVNAALAQETPSSSLDSQTPATATSSNVGSVVAPSEPIYGNSLDGSLPTVVASDNAELALPARLPFHVAVTISGGYDDNINTSSVDPVGSAFLNALIGLNYRLGKPGTQMSLQTGGGVTYYFDRPGEGDSDYNGYLGFQLTEKLSPRMTFGASLYATYTSEPNFNLNLGINRRIGSYFYSSDGVTLNYLWNPRFTTLSSYSFGAFFHEGQNTPQQLPNDPSNIGNSDDRIENTIGNQFRYLFGPTTTVVAEYRLGFITYQTNSAFDSVTHYALAGFDQTFSPRFNISFRGGAQFRFYNNDTDSSSPNFEATLNYRLGRQSWISWFANYGLQPADLANTAQRTTFRTGVNATYGWTARIFSTVGFIYEHDDYGAANNFSVGSEDTLNLALTTRYAVTRYFALQASYNFTDVISGQALRGYTRNHISVGVDFKF